MAETSPPASVSIVNEAFRLEQGKVAEEIRKFLSYELSDEFDKRRYPRVPVCLPVTYFVSREGRWEKTESKMQALNLSASGLKAVAHEKLATGSFLLLRFQLPSRSRSQIVGQVKWCSELWGKWIIGVEFTEQHPINKKMLQDFVSLQRSKWFDDVARRTGKDRRKFFRVPARISVPFMLYVGRISQKWERQKERIHLLDLSAGGASFQSGKVLANGQLVSFELPVEQELLPVVAQIVRVKVESNGEISYGGQFLNLEEKHREAIVRYVFREEQRLARREKPADGSET